MQRSIRRWQRAPSVRQVSQFFVSGFAVSSSVVRVLFVGSFSFSLLFVVWTGRALGAPDFDHKPALMCEMRPILTHC